MGPAGVLARLTAIALVLVGLAYAGGFFLPRERTIESKTVILASPEKVFDLVANVKGQAAWRDDVSDIRVEEGSDPLAWSETSAGWRLSFREVVRERPNKLELEFESPSGFRGRRTYEFTKTNDTGNRTNFKRTDVIEIANPLRRVYSYLFMNLQSEIDAQTQDLGREFLADPSAPRATPTPASTDNSDPSPAPSGVPSPSGEPTPTGSTLPGGSSPADATAPGTSAPTASPTGSRPI